MHIFYDPVNFDEPTYCCICEGYMYFADTLEAPVVVLNTEWKLDKHMVG